MCMRTATYKAEHEDEWPEDLVWLWLEQVPFLVIFTSLTKVSDGRDQGKDQTNEHNSRTDHLEGSGTLTKNDKSNNNHIN